MSGEIRSQHTQLYACLAGGTTVATLGNISDLGEFGGQADDIEVTNLDDTAKQFLVGLIDNGEMTVQLNLNPQDANHQDLQAKAGNGVRYPFLVGLSDGVTAPTAVGGDLVPPVAANRTSFAFDASIKSFKFGAKTNDAIRVTVTLRISGAITPVWKTP